MTLLENELKVKEDIKELYDKTAETYGSEYLTPAGNYFMKYKIETILELGDFKDCNKILEVGCSNGAYTFEFNKLGYFMYGLDLSDKNIEFAKKKAEQNKVSNVEFYTGDAEALPFEDNLFDGTISISTLRYVPNIQNAVNEIYRVLKPGKRAVLDFPNKNSPWFNYLKPRVLKRRHIHDNHYTTAEIRRLFSNAGFKEIKIKRILFTPKATPPVLLPLMRCIDFVGERFVPLNEFAAIIICSGVK